MQSAAHFFAILLLYLTVTSTTHAQQTTDKDDLLDVIEQLQHGSPDLDDMEPALRIVVRQRRHEITQYLRSMGPVLMVTFEDTQQGVDTYYVQFQIAQTIWQFARSPRGKIAVLYFQAF